jgi:isopenicillin N synthase-like dioxygenase
METSNPSQTIPVASLKDFAAGGARRQAFVKTVGDALIDIGFFALEDHGVDMGVINKSYALAEELFLKPTSEKLKYEDTKLKGQRGYISFGREHAKDAKAPDLKEFWHVGQELPPGHPLAAEYPPNIWPTGMPAFKTTMLDLFARLEACSLSILEACALYIGEPQDRFSSIAKTGNTILRVIHYPPIPPDANPASIRAAAHEDINLITLLCEATTGGLELLERNGTWRPIHALKGQIVVDSGDMLQNISNGYFRSTTHRVVNPDNSRERRFSMPFFVHPRSEASLDPLQSCVARTGGAKKFPAITAGAYLDKRLKEIGLG